MTGSNMQKLLRRTCPHTAAIGLVVTKEPKLAPLCTPRGTKWPSKEKTLPLPLGQPRAQADTLGEMKMLLRGWF